MEVVLIPNVSLTDANGRDIGEYYLLSCTLFFLM
jgi:hypothetical protein